MHDVSISPAYGMDRGVLFKILILVCVKDII